MCFQLDRELLVLALEPGAPAEDVDGAMLGGGHEPGARIVRDARRGPPLQRGDQRVLRQVFGNTNVAHDPRDSSDQLGRLDSPNRVDRSMGIRSRHGYQSDPLRPPVQGNPRHDYRIAISAPTSAGLKNWRTSDSIWYEGPRMSACTWRK